MRTLRILAVILVLCASGELLAQGDNADALSEDGLKAAAENRLSDAITLFQRALQRAPHYSPFAYNLACVYSRKGDTANAVKWLGQAADWGFEDVAHILADADLKNIRAHPGYAQILEDIQNRLPESKPRPYVAPAQPERGLELVAMLRSELGSGAAIILSHEGDRVYLATANHVVRQGTEAAGKIEVQLKALAPRWHKARLLPAIADSELDLAIIAVDGIAGPKFDFCALPLDLGGESKPLHRGDAVYPVGYPGGILWAMPLVPDHASQVLPSQISFESQFVRVGFSGGALLNDRGELLGMITADEPPLGRVVPLAPILKAVRAAGYPVQLSGRGARATTPLQDAAKAGDVATVRRLLENCADPNASDATGRTALHEAAAQGSAEVVRLLLNRGARQNAWAVIRAEDSEREWGTPLHVAAERGNTEAVKALLVGADVDIETLLRSDDDREIERANGALHLAARRDRGDVAEVLLAAGAAMDIQPLGIAAANGAVNVARVLLAHGAAVQTPDNEYQPSPLQRAAEAGKVEMLKLLLERGADVNLTNSSKFISTALHAAVAQGQVQAAEFLIAHNATVDAPGYRGSTPLHAAAKMGSRAAVELLLAHGADVNRMNEQNETPIELAAGRDDLGALQALVNAKADIGYLLLWVLERKKGDAARILIQGGADVSLKLPGGAQALHVAAMHEMAEAIELLLKAGAAVNAVDAEGSTPLHHAARSGHLPSVELLLAAKAAVNAQDRAGWTALYTAVCLRRTAVVGRLLEAGANPNLEIQPTAEDDENENTAVARAASRGPAEILASLLAAGGDPNRRGNAPLSPLALAARSRAAEKTVPMLLKAGARVVTEDETTPALHAAIAGNSPADAVVVALLLAAGAPVETKNANGRTPLQEAADEMNLEAVKALLAAGANVDAADKCGATALWFTTPGVRYLEQQMLALTEVLVAAGADVNVKSTCNGQSLMDMVEMLGYGKVRQFLLAKGAKSERP